MTGRWRLVTLVAGVFCFVTALLFWLVVLGVYSFPFPAPPEPTPTPPIAGGRR